MSLINKMLAVKGAKGVKAELMKDAPFFHSKPLVTGLPILNMAFTGKVDGGLMPGITIFSGESGTFKTLLGLYCVKSYLDEHEDGICIFYDNEFGTTPEYMETFGIDMDRLIHINPMHIEELKFDMVKRLEAISKGDKVILLFDSLGAASSKKEIDDAIDEKSVADMTRAKAIRSWLRTVSPHITNKELSLIIINHTYKEIGLYPKTIIPGGTAVEYMANQIFVITKAKLEELKDQEGNKFTLGIHKSRFIRKGKRFPLEVTYDDGVYKYSGLLEIAREAGIIQMPTSGWYRLRGTEEKLRRKDLDADFWQPILDSDEFKEYVEKSYKLKPIEAEVLDDREDDLIEFDPE